MNSQNTKYTISNTFAISNGAMEQEYSYNACLPVRNEMKAGGKRRMVDNWNANVSFNTDNFLTVRGYTLHEHLDKVNLINMPACRTLGRNGRLYDPLTARMLSPDPFVQSPDYTQSYNRYSYCFNNPLKYVDPSGYMALPDLIQYMWDLTPNDGWSYWSASNGTVSWGGDANNLCPYVTFPSKSGAEGANSVAGNTVKYLSRFEKAINKLARFFAGQTNRFGIAANHNYSAEEKKSDYLPNKINEDNPPDDPPKEKDNPLIPGPYDDSWRNLKVQLGRLDHALDGYSNGGKIPAPIKFIADINPLIALSNGVKIIVTGNDIYYVKKNVSQGLWLLISGYLSLNNITLESIVIDQVAPLIIDKIDPPKESQKKSEN